MSLRNCKAEAISAGVYVHFLVIPAVRGNPDWTPDQVRGDGVVSENRTKKFGN